MNNTGGDSLMAKQAQKLLTLRQTLASLRYIAESPSHENGGFHEQAILCAKSAIHHIKKLRQEIPK